MKTYLYIDSFKIEQEDIIECQPKTGNLERSHKRQRIAGERSTVENSIMYLAKKARNEDRNKRRKAARYAKRK